MSNKLFFSLESIKPKKNDAAGSMTYVTSDDVSGFENISFATLKLNKGGFQEPIWHPNANKIGYCSQGSALVSIRSPGSADKFTIQEGDVFFIRKGYVHHIENIGDKENIINFAFDHNKPQVICLSKAIFSLTDQVFSSTFNTPPDFFNGLKKGNNQEQIKTLPSKKEPPYLGASDLKFNVAASNKPIQTKGGYLQASTKANLPILEGLGLLRFGLNAKGIVEPHWHTNAGELVYIIKGQTRITVLSPDGNVDVLDVKGGQGAFAPASHFHNIENVGNEEVEVIAFFNHAEPDYIGIGEVFGSYSNEVLAAIFNLSPDYFDRFKKPDKPLVIVPI